LEYELMSSDYWKPYVSVAARRAKAETASAKAKKAGKDMQPVVITTRSVASSFWGKAWCNNLEAYSDYANRLPRGRSYARNGSVIDLKITPGKVHAQVVGSRKYQVEISVSTVSTPHWQALAKQCTGAISSLVELLQGKLSDAVMTHICAPTTGLFPKPKDIQFACSCPDSASMCKHVAAVLYGIGARLDAQPELLFSLRQVDANELVTQAAQGALTQQAPKGRVLDDAQLADVFGIEMALPVTMPVTKGIAATKSLAKKQAVTTAKKAASKSKAAK
jgi:uncharacterized Zn finger protein